MPRGNLKCFGAKLLYGHLSEFGALFSVKSAEIEKSALGELRCTASSLETVLLSFLHSRVTSEEAGFFELAAQVLAVVLEQRS